jgi:para-aminobenzoate synthetase component 1
MRGLTTHELPYQADSAALFALMRDLPDAIWLDSGKPLSSQGRYDLISASPDSVIETRGDLSTISDSLGVRESAADPFELVKQLLDPLLDSAPGSGSGSESDSVASCNHPFVGGVIGYFGYDLGRRCIPITPRATAVTALPDMRVGRYLWALEVDHLLQQSRLIFHRACPDDLKLTIIQRLQTPQSSSMARFSLKTPFKPTLSQSEYDAAIARIKHYIAAGDCYQTNFTQHFSATYSGDLWAAYLALRRQVASPYSAFWQWRDQALLCLSPERFVQSIGGVVETKPIKGTIVRGATPEEDHKNAQTLLNSAKDRAENLMIVDLLRNDLSKSCAAGSIAVPTLFALESFPNVHHLVSTVTGVLSDNASPIDLLRNCFPGGSITGAPKKRAMEIIEELEPVRRSAYCGSVGYISANQRMDSNITIRTVLADGDQLHCWGGGGIVADSQDECEYEESVNKIRAILKTLETFI